mgnify:CR=1 FL=1
MKREKSIFVFLQCKKRRKREIEREIQRENMVFMSCEKHFSREDRSFSGYRKISLHNQ